MFAQLQLSHLKVLLFSAMPKHNMWQSSSIVFVRSTVVTWMFTWSQK